MNEDTKPKDTWASGNAYEPYIGRWSRLVAHEFLGWLAIPTGSLWLDVGCGTGALSQTILQETDPVGVRGVDPSEGFIAFARDHTPDRRVQFEVGNAEAIKQDSGFFDVAVSGLVLNFIPHPEHAVAEMRRVTRKGGMVAAYLWDYANGMQMIRHFFDAAVALDPNAAALDEGSRFPLCHPQALTDLFNSIGLKNVEVRSIDVPTVFHNFDDYWSPFLGGQGPAPSYAMSLNEESRTALRERIRARLPVESDGSIALTARAWAVRGTH